MEWIKQFIEFIKVISWPLVLLIVAIMFKRQLSDLTVRLTKAKLPGGFELELAALKSSLANEAPTLLETIINPHSPHPHRLVAELEKSVIKLAQRCLGVGVDLNDYKRELVLQDLVSSRRISKTEFHDIQKLFSILEGARIEDADQKELEQVILAVSIVVARLEEIYNVEYLRYDFQASLMWHYRESYEDKTFSEKYHFWSAIAAKATEFNYSYEAYVEAANIHNKNEEKYRIYIPSLDEFIDILEFRKSELKRFIKDYQNVSEWRWPDHWGPVIWNGPIIREGGANKALREQVDTNLAIQFYRNKRA